MNCGDAQSAKEITETHTPEDLVARFPGAHGVLAVQRFAVAVLRLRGSPSV